MFKNNFKNFLTTESYRYPGIRIDGNLSIKEHIKERKDTFSEFAFAISKIDPKNMPFEYRVTLLQSLALSKIL